LRKIRKTINKDSNAGKKPPKSGDLSGKKKAKVATINPNAKKVINQYAAVFNSAYKK